MMEKSWLNLKNEVVVITGALGGMGKKSHRTLLIKAHNLH